jgi:phosphopantothenoylcysteine decarboxylase/phosphopantothenate--cysteine ligase
MRIVLGVSGGIAAYKSAELSRLLIRNGHDVQVVMTRAAQQFITPLTFASLTGRKVITDLFSDASPEATLSSSVEHIGVAQEHDLLLVAPATANVLAKFAQGLADDFLSTMYLAFRGPVVLAPAMNNNMWEHPATQANLAALRARGHRIVEPGNGFLACGTYGPGRLAENEAIVDAVEAVALRDLSGETILITAGLAQAALDRGAKVILVSGPVALDPPAGADVIRVRTAAEMRDAVFAHIEPATIAILCAAVADFRPIAEAEQKIKKSTALRAIDLEPTPDILAELGQTRGHRLLIGFAAETQNLREEARRKLETKNCDMIVANRVGVPGSGFESDSNEVVLALRSGEFVELPYAPKREIADQILSRIPALKEAPALAR